MRIHSAKSLLSIILILFVKLLVLFAFKNSKSEARFGKEIRMIDGNWIVKQAKIFTGIAIVSFPLLVSGTDTVNAKIPLPKVSKIANDLLSSKSPAIQLAIQKRNAAVKAMQEKGILKVYTDDLGNQFLNVPWIPNQKILYKSIPFNTRLWNELCAGALGEISKDVLLHAVDTAKTRRQAQKKSSSSPSLSNSLILSQINRPYNTSFGINNLENIPIAESFSVFGTIKDLYSGFPVVLASSIPQGGAFFLVKKGFTEVLTKYVPSLPNFLTSTLPIGAGVMVYWLFRTPAEVIKTQVQTKQSNNVIEALDIAKKNPQNGYLSLWKYYPVVLSLDIPFQIINFILFSILTEYVTNAGYEQSILTRLFCGITCGMIAAGLTCPLDVCKTRIIARDKANSQNSTNLFINSNKNMNKNMVIELISIFETEGPKSLFLGLGQRLLYTGLANGIRLSAYGTSRMDLMMRSLDNL